jgi:hypothetical protein
MQWPPSGEVPPPCERRHGFGSALYPVPKVFRRDCQFRDRKPLPSALRAWSSRLGHVQIGLPSSLAGGHPGGFEEMFLVAKLNLKFGVVSRFRVYSW